LELEECQSVSLSELLFRRKPKKLKNIKTKTLFPAEVVEPSSFSKNLEEQEQEQMQQFPSSWTYCANNQKTKQNQKKKPPKFAKILYFKKTHSRQRKRFHLPGKPTF
jgi:hypothetical protein